MESPRKGWWPGRLIPVGIAVLILLGLAYLLTKWIVLSPRVYEPWEDGTFTVASYNIKWGNHDWKATAEVIKETDADVVFVQESSEDAESHLPRYLSREYPHMEFRNASSRCGYAILSRFPLKNVRTLLRDDGSYYLAMFADVVLGDEAISLANVHLRYKELLFSTEPVRARQIERIWQLLPEAEPIIVAGDFNSFPNQKAPTFLKARGLLDSYSSANPKDQTGTWHWQKGPLRVFVRIDYIFHTRHFATRDSRIIRKGPSDHFPVVSVLVRSDEYQVGLSGLPTQPTSMPFYR